MFDNDDWLAQVQESTIDPNREIVDPHHHLWPQASMSYNLEELWEDTSAGHNVTQTVFIECGASYHETGPAHLRPVGETEFVTRAAKRSLADPKKATIAGIIAHADLKHNELDDIIDAHEQAADGLLRGIRHSGAHDTDPEALTIPGRGAKDQYRDPAFQRGVQRLGERGLTYDTWHYHHQNMDFVELAKAVPDTTLILDHFGTPLGVGKYANKRDEIFASWKDHIYAISECPNVIAKLGGLAMPDNGFGWDKRTQPPTSDEFVDAQARYYEHTIDCFGADRCMFESNFPVDRLSISYNVLWNGLKKIAARYEDSEKESMFSGTARRVYKL